MSLELELLVEIKGQLGGIEAHITEMKEQHKKHQETTEKHQGQIQTLDKDINKAKGAVQLLYLISVLVGILIAIGRLRGNL